MTDHGKSQFVRLADVFFIGPLMTWGGIVWSESNKIPGYVLALLGFTTVIYNGANYLRLREK